MARPLRIEYDGAVYHVTSRGNARKPIYRDDEDRRTFLETLQKVNTRYNWICHAYCLMSNHYHLLIETPDANLSKGMRQLNGVYTQMYNKRHRRVGHIFQGRYKAILIQKESHLLEVSRYVVLNPVRALIVTKPEQWMWSSYRGTAGKDKPNACLTVDWILVQFGKKKSLAEAKYSEFVVAGISGIREKSIWKEIKGQSILGDEQFVKYLLNYVRDYEDVKEIPKSQRLIGKPRLQEIFRRNISKKYRKARDSKITEAALKYGYSQREIADFLGLHYTTVSRIINEQ